MTTKQHHGGQYKKMPSYVVLTLGSHESNKTNKTVCPNFRREKVRMPLSV